MTRSSDAALPRNGKSVPTGRIVALLIAAGLLVGVSAMTAAAVMYKNSLRTRVTTIAESLYGQGVSELNGALTSVEAENNYQYFKDRLARIKGVNADARFIYLMARNDNGGIYFLADSEPQDSQDHSPHGEPFPEATDKLKGVFNDRVPVVEGPVRDSYGTWLSALAPVYDDRNHQLAGVVGMDVPATSYALLLGLAGGVPLLLALLASLIVYVSAQTRRRHLESVQFRAEMLSIASHELRTPLTGLRWSQESLLGRKFDASKQQRMLEIMHDSTLRLQESIEDILQLASLESGKQQRLFIKEADLRSMLEDIMSVQRLGAERRGVALTLADSWPDKLVVECDAQRLKRVFHNLLSNAIKYSEKGTEVLIGYGHSKKGGHVISVRDQGIGIPAEEQAKIWSGFYRASNAADHDVVGTGMGLYLSRSIVEQHGGRIWLESKVSEGTTVFVELPDKAA
jgi:signal transduction histidine kinase